jgi:putative holliday junction resolvase
VVSAIGLDVGSKRIGVAGCDSTGLIATGLTTVVRTNLPADLEALRTLVLQRRAEAVIVGLPKNMNGTLGQQAQRTQLFGTRLQEALGVSVHYVDERLTTVQAERSMQRQGLSALKRRALIDQQAAAIILQQWLDIRRHQQLCPIQESIDERDLNP